MVTKSVKQHKKAQYRSGKTAPTFIFRNVHKLKVILPSCFCIQDNLNLLEHVSSARVAFDSKMYVDCRDILAAEQLMTQLQSFQLDLNRILKVKRLGPGFLAMQPKVHSSRVLSVAKLHPSTTYEELLKIFPTAVDIAKRKTLAVVVFSSAALCSAARVAADARTRWPHGEGAVCRPEHKFATHEEIAVPSQYIEDFILKPTVVEINLKHKFNFETDLSIIKFISSNTQDGKVYFSRKFSAGFSESSDALAARIALEATEVGGKKIECILKYNEPMKVKAPAHWNKEKKPGQVEPVSQNLDSEIESEDENEEESESESQRLPIKKGKETVQNLDSDFEESEDDEGEEDDESGESEAEEDEMSTINGVDESDDESNDQDESESEAEIQPPPMKKKKMSHHKTK